MSDALLPSPGQTIGPFFRYGLEFKDGGNLKESTSPGAVRLYGQIFDGAGEPVPDALIEIWQTNAKGAIPEEEGSFHRDGITFTGWGRVHTSELGEYEFWTEEPGASFFAVVIFARGLTDRLHTRIYLPERADDALLNGLSEDERETLVAVRTSEGLRHDIHLQGAGETVFLAFR